MPHTPPDGDGSIRYLEYRDGSVGRVSGAVIEERPVCIFVNGRELATLLCTPSDLEDLAVGFAFTEGLIDGIDDIEVMSVSAGLTCVDLWLRDRVVEPPTRRIITSGCGGGVTFDDTATMLARHKRLGLGMTVAPSQVSRLMREVLRSAALYNTARGVHTSALSDGASVVLVAQDVGRHNTIDRLAGRALRTGLATEGAIVLTSGRISSEMLAKAAGMRAPVVISRTCPTSLAVELAQAWNVTLVGYARGTGFRVYAAPERIGPPTPQPGPRSLAGAAEWPVVSGSA
ncbi:MAG: formate dehydrogenase accessory sulfurtransferase FdhD [Actinobacteria bacterium]|nr:formate dehydrogenase accessory sulfurtransferase FdhD [Actinomycetota bacterium]